ncbi:hypothetical protein F8M41_023076 [Gigaspora margarita]|uniref:Uncharacterized protein n=1 Tax=Gigaspora margarita TaxID=4874 RepID=A0A8H4AE03_GIGMA|nr:hypothetical protein F8M41_023076 [Gigaspora margarita]
MKLKFEKERNKGIQSKKGIFAWGNMERGGEHSNVKHVFHSMYRWARHNLSCMVIESRRKSNRKKSIETQLIFPFYTECKYKTEKYFFWPRWRYQRQHERNKDVEHEFAKYTNVILIKHGKDK